MALALGFLVCEWLLLDYVFKLADNDCHLVCEQLTCLNGF
jgi:hypothetical protein